ncbi:hypothetical protein M3Y99_01145700 [Aphelenchoides fujianensis]|nr:hypothetical protein M3Y99_01145700 [Aphelenchoides fujianensis]
MRRNSAAATSADLFERPGGRTANDPAFDFRPVASRSRSASGTRAAASRAAASANPLVSVGEVYNDTSSGYSTASGTSVAAPGSSATVWTRAGAGKDFEFVPIREEETPLTDEEAPQAANSGGPAWRQQSRYGTAPTATPTKRTSSLHELLNSFDHFDPEPLLQRAVQATQRAARYLGEAEPQFARRPNTALGNPFPSGCRPLAVVRPPLVRRHDRRAPPARVVDVRDFPSTNRGDPHAFRSRHPNGPTISGRALPPARIPPPPHRTSSFPAPPVGQQQRPAERPLDWLSVSVPPTSTPAASVDTSALDAVLHSPGRGSEPPVQRRPQSALPFGDFRTRKEEEPPTTDEDADDPMGKTTAGWQKRFDNVRERFGDATAALDDVEAALNRFTSFATDGSTTVPRNGANRGGFLAKSASQNTMDRRNNNNDRSSLLDSAVTRRAAEAPETTSPRAAAAVDRLVNDERLHARNPIGNFWLETVRNRLDSPATFQRAFSPRLTAAERLAELHEPLPADDLKGHSASPAPHEHLAYRRPNAADSVAQRRAQYLNETLRAQTPTGSLHSTSTTVPNVTVSDLNGNPKSAALPTGTPPNFSSLNDTVAELQNGASGCGRFPTEVRYTTTTNHPDGRTTRSYFGQTAYSTGNGGHAVMTTTRSTTSGGWWGPSWTFGGPYATTAAGRRLLTTGGAGFASNAFNAPSVSPNFPSPTSGGVASRISALEKRPGGAPNLLQLACVLTGNQTAGDSAPMSPRSTVYRTKPVIRVDYEDAEPTAKQQEPSVFRFPAVPNERQVTD